ncbi:ThiF family adenylyltransferase [Streptococcus sp. NLN64]|uniref:HesA/MoeB/ThiF family protein n=1 Tax=Streptococcus sp. NLN64 TaxID=2822799 RepID=UPI0018CAA7DE|nr:ThiF family adenylyltransferase [Streptococcus sp. NLN64]MBG9366881.1 ThiF family adenylyltransferase [Streptococcus sp. NLN64]
MKLIINSIIHPIFRTGDSYYFKYNNKFVGIENIEIVVFLIELFDKNEEILFDELIKLFERDLDFTEEESREIIEDLIDVGFLTEKVEKDRYFTNTLFFSLFDNKNKSRYQEILKNSEVCILGLGGSSLIVQQLAQIGIGKISGLDFDILEESNLNRQVIYKEQDIGKLKNEALKANLNEINSKIVYDFQNIRVVSRESIRKVISTADIVIVALDEPIIDSSIWIYDECKSQNKKVISGGVWGDSIVYTYFDYSLPNQPCYRCMFNEDIKQANLGMDYAINIKGKSYSNFNTTTIFVGGVLAGIISTEIVKILTNYASPIVSGEMLSINTSTWDLIKEKIRLDGLCVICRQEEF